ncbi:hypothetical protein Vafri_15339, partial [Volvox africanus]
PPELNHGAPCGEATEPQPEAVPQRSALQTRPAAHPASSVVRFPTAPPPFAPPPTAAAAAASPATLNPWPAPGDGHRRRLRLRLCVMRVNCVCGRRRRFRGRAQGGEGRGATYRGRGTSSRRTEVIVTSGGCGGVYEPVFACVYVHV